MEYGVNGCRVVLSQHERVVLSRRRRREEVATKGEEMAWVSNLGSGPMTQGCPNTNFWLSKHGLWGLQREIATQG